ncbi:MAG: T9SS type A sorting domain-containing protein [Crocinitomicaceae bacterium]
MCTESGVYQEIYTSATGCDSLLIYEIKIIQLDSTADWIGPMTIEANESGATYQWIDCNNSNAIIPGANDKTYVAAVNGDYACVVEKDGCTKTTNCIRIQSLDLTRFKEDAFNVYPNPSHGLFFIELYADEPNTKVEITNSLGQIVYQSNLSRSITPLRLNSMESGLYIVSVIGSEAIIRKTIKIEK